MHKTQPAVTSTRTIVNVNGVGVSGIETVTRTEIVEVTLTQSVTEVDVVTVDATATGQETLTIGVPIDATASLTETLTSINTVPQTLLETTLVTVANDIPVTVVETVEASATVVQTSSVSTSVPLSPGCAGVGGTPYTSPNGKVFDLNCGGFYVRDPFRYLFYFKLLQCNGVIDSRSRDLRSWRITHTPLCPLATPLCPNRLPSVSFYPMPLPFCFILHVDKQEFWLTGYLTAYSARRSNRQRQLPAVQGLHRCVLN